MNPRLKYIFIFVFVLFIAVNASAFGRRQAAAPQADTVIITGRIVVYGSEPRTFIGIANTEGGEYFVYSPEHEAELRSLQGHLIEFTVEIIDTENNPTAAPSYGAGLLRSGTVRPISWQIVN